MNLSEKQKKYLRGLGHHIKPIITIGEKGITEALLIEFEKSLDHHELIKVKVRDSDRQSRNKTINNLFKKQDINMIQRIGNIVLIYRANPKKKPENKLRLPSH
tara:strand:+ start:3229 stop:3537 length:309 start_codon:yes stop_codon:yes gene_type:complete